MSGVRAETSIGRQGDGGGMHQGFSSWGYEMCLKPGCTQNVQTLWTNCMCGMREREE